MYPYQPVKIRNVQRRQKVLHKRRIYWLLGSLGKFSYCLFSDCWGDFFPVEFLAFFLILPPSLRRKKDPAQDRGSFLKISFMDALAKKLI